MADNNSLLSSKKLLSSLLGGDRQEDSTVIAPDGTNVLRNRSNSKGITEVIEDDNKDLLRVLKRGFGLDEFERPSEARVDQSDDGSGGNSGSGFLSKIGSILAGVGSAIAAAAGAALTLAIPAIAVALAAAVGTAVGAALYKIIPKSAQDAIGSAAMRASAAAGNETDKRLVDADNERIRKQYTDEVKAASDKGLPESSVPIPVEIRGEVGSNKSALEKAKYVADMAYGNTLGKVMPGKNKALERVDAYRNDAVKDYVNSVDDSGKVMDNSAPPNRHATTAGTSIQDLLKRYESHDNAGIVQGGSGVRSKNGVFKPKTFDLEHMTVAEVLALSKKVDGYDDKPGSGTSTGAAGLYQIIPATLENLVKNKHIGIHEKFSRENQEKLGKVLIDQAVKRSDGTPEGIQTELAKTWSSAPVGRDTATRKGHVRKAGESYYPSEKSAYGLSTALAAVKNSMSPVKARPQMATEPLPEPVEPVRVASAGDGGGGGGGGGSAGPGSSASALSLDNMLDIPSDDALTSLLSGKI